MALPTLRPYYVTRQSQPRMERLLVRRHTHEADMKQRWKENARYFANSDMRSSKQEAWTSSQSFMDRWVLQIPKYVHVIIWRKLWCIYGFSMAAYETQGRVDEKKQILKERKEKLASLLTEERQMYEVRLKLVHVQ